MDPFLRLLQIALIITQIYQSQQTSSSISLSTISTTSTCLSVSSTCLNVSSTCLNVSSTCLHASSTCLHASSTCLNVSSTCLHASSTCLNVSSTCLSVSSTNLNVSSNYSNASVTSPVTPATSLSIWSSSTQMPPVTTSTAFSVTKVASTLATITQPSPFGTPSTTGEKTVKQTVSTIPDTSALQTTGVHATLTESASQTASPGSPAKSTQSTLQTSNVSVTSNESVSPRSNVSAASTEPASNGSTTPESTKAVSVGHSGSISHYMTANYKPGSDASTRTKASSTVQSLTPSPVSLDWTDWSVDSDDCEKYCSEKGGTVTASRQCKSHSSTLANSVCSIHDNTTKVFECGEPHCPISGTEAFRSFISVVAVSILLTKLTTFV